MTQELRFSRMRQVHDGATTSIRDTYSENQLSALANLLSTYPFQSQSDCTLQTRYDVHFHHHRHQQQIVA